MITRCKSKVSVIVPTYNCAPYLEEAVMSVVRQRGVDVEIVVVDDGSTDQTQAVLDRLKGIAQLQVCRQQNSGVAAARNLGLARATGDIVCFLDADDVLTEDSLALRVAAIEVDPARFGMAFGDWLASPGGGDIHSYFEAANVIPQLMPAITCCHGNLAFLAQDEMLAVCRRNWSVVFTGAVALTRDVINKTGLFDVQRTVGEDTDYWYRALQNTRAVCVLQPVAQYNTSRSPSQKYEASIQRRLDLLRPSRRSFSGEIARRREIATCYADLIYRKYGVRRMFHEARAQCVAGLSYWPASKVLWKFLVASFVPARAALIPQQIRCAIHRAQSKRLLRRVPACLDQHRQSMA